MKSYWGEWKRVSRKIDPDRFDDGVNTIYGPRGFSSSEDINVSEKGQTLFAVCYLMGL